MKLNMSSESNLSPHISIPTPPPRSPPSASTRLLTAGTQTDPPRRCPRRALLFIAALAALLPFLLPLAITQAVKLVDSRRAPQPSRADWSRWGAVRNGRLYVSETFENRLNEHSGTLYTRFKSRFHRSCDDHADVRFALNPGGPVHAWVEVTMRCGLGSCVHHGEVGDVRDLVVKMNHGRHFVQAGGRMWGPLRGPLKVGLDADARLALRRVCKGKTDHAFLSAREIRTIVGDVDVFHVDVGRGLPRGR